MLGVAVLASWLAQVADPAYAVPEPPGPPPPRAPVDDLPVDASNSLGVQGRFAYRLLGSEPTLGPAAGYSVGASFEHRYGEVMPGLELGVAVDLFYDRFTADVAVPILNASGVVLGMTQAQRLLMQTSFAALQVIGLRTGALRFFAGLGGGVAIAYLSDPETSIASRGTTEVQPVARACAGMEVALRGRVGLVIRGDFTHPLTSPDYRGYQPFGDVFDAGAGAVYRF